MKTAKTNAARILDQSRIPYRLVSYEVDEEDLSAGHLAERLGLEPGIIFKTLVLRGDRTSYLVAVIPGDRELDLKKTARASGNKSCSMIPMKDLKDVTGYIRGGCSPVGMKKRFPTYIHSTASEYAEIYVSAGLRGVQLAVAPKDLMRVTGAIMADLTAD